MTQRPKLDIRDSQGSMAMLDTHTHLVTGAVDLSDRSVKMSRLRYLINALRALRSAPFQTVRSQRDYSLRFVLCPC
jgi:predicted amidohydrolase YtcJ